MVLTSGEETLFREAYQKRFGPMLDHKILEVLICNFLSNYVSYLFANLISFFSKSFQRLARVELRLIQV